mmetsp:Transcript_8511/g.35586  ORF Transcript_8511/g.35586 Transcript_8511/m.35586 type:complete len:201 (-) Transcript_8511:841-1443(-)
MGRSTRLLRLILARRRRFRLCRRRRTAWLWRRTRRRLGSRRRRRRRRRVVVARIVVSPTARFGVSGVLVRRRLLGAGALLMPGALARHRERLRRLVVALVRRETRVGIVATERERRRAAFGLRERVRERLRTFRKSRLDVSARRLGAVALVAVAVALDDRRAPARHGVVHIGGRHAPALFGARPRTSSLAGDGPGQGKAP